MQQTSLSEAPNERLSRPCAVARESTRPIEDLVGVDAAVVEMVAFPDIPDTVAVRCPNRVHILPLDGREAIELGKVGHKHLADGFRSMLLPLSHGRLLIQVAKTDGNIGTLECWTINPPTLTQTFKAPWRQSIDRVVDLGNDSIALAMRMGSNTTTPVKIWNVRTGQSKKTKISLGESHRLVGAFNEHALVCASQSHISAWNPSDGSQLIEQDLFAATQDLCSRRLNKNTLAICMATEKFTTVQCFHKSRGWIGPIHRDRAQRLQVAIHGHHLLRSSANGLCILDLRSFRHMASFSCPALVGHSPFCMASDQRFVYATKQNTIELMRLEEEIVQVCPEHGVDLKEIQPLFEVRQHGLLISCQLVEDPTLATTYFQSLGLLEPQQLSADLQQAFAARKWTDPKDGQRDVLLWLLTERPAEGQLALLHWALASNEQVCARHIELMFNRCQNVALMRIPFCLTELLFATSDEPQKRQLSQLLFRALDMSAHFHMTDRRCIAAFKGMVKQAVHSGIISRAQAHELKSTAEDCKTFNTLRFQKIEQDIRCLKAAVDANRRNILVLGETVKRLETALRKKARREILFGIAKIAFFFGGGLVVDIACGLVNLRKLSSLVPFIPDVDVDMAQDGVGQLTHSAGSHITERPLRQVTFNRNRFKDLCSRAEEALEQMDEPIEAQAHDEELAPQGDQLSTDKELEAEAAKPESD